jgi:amino acid permease
MSLLYIENGTQHSSDDDPNSTKTIADSVSLPSIGFLGSLSIAVNSITGPAMVNLPLAFQQSGIIPTTVTLVFISILSSLCSLHMANTISKVPGNEAFRKEIEFSQAFYMFWGRRWWYFTQAVYFLCVTCLNVSSIVDTAQVVDVFMGHWLPSGAVALEIGSSATQFVWWDLSSCSHDELVSGECIPFEQHSGMLLTAGYIITVVSFLPLALMDLKVRYDV